MGTATLALVLAPIFPGINDPGGRIPPVLQRLGPAISSSPDGRITYLAGGHTLDHDQGRRNPCNPLDVVFVP